MSTTPPVSLWPDPDALGTLTDLYELTMMAGYHAAGHGRPEGYVRVVCPKDAGGQGLPGLRRARAGRSATCSSWPSIPEQIDEIRRWPAFHGVEPARAWTSSRPRDSRAMSAPCPRERSSSPARPCCESMAPLPQAQWVETHLLDSIAYPTLVASKAARIVAAAAGRPLYEFGARRGHGPLAGLARRAVGHDRRLRRHEPRRGRPAAGRAGRRHHGPLVGPVVPDRGRGVRDVRPHLSRQHHPAGRHLRHARRRSTGRVDRAAGSGDSNRQRRSRCPRQDRLARSSTSTAARM